MPDQRGSVLQQESALRLPPLSFPLAPFVPFVDILLFLTFLLRPNRKLKTLSHAGLNSSRRIISSLILRASRSVVCIRASLLFSVSSNIRSSYYSTISFTIFG